MIYTIENGYLSAQISDIGAELQSLMVRSTGEEYIWQGNPDVWSGRSPLLFPVVGRLKADQYRYDGKTYSMQKHGFARMSVFETTVERPDRLTMTLRSGEHTDSYPFEFVLELTFELVGAELKITHRVTNKDSKDMFFSLGAHPGFCCAMGDYIEFPEDESAWAYRLTDEEKLLTDRPVEQGVRDHRLVVTEDIFKNDALIFRGIRSDKATLYCAGRSRATVEFGSAPCLGVWAKPGAPYVCIEPWFGLDDSEQAAGDIETKPHIVRLEAGGCFRFPVTIVPHI